MSIPYKVVKQSFGFDETKAEKYVVKSVAGETVPFTEIRKQVTQVCGIHRGMVKLVLDGLLDVMMNNLQMGHNVQLGEFGSLRPAFRAKAQDIVETATVESVYRKKINFVPGKMLKNFLEKVSLSRIDIPKIDYTK